MSSDKQDSKPKVDLGLLEEDDEFEEFPAEGMIQTLQYAKTDQIMKKNSRYFILPKNSHCRLLAPCLPIWQILTS